MTPKPQNRKEAEKETERVLRQYNKPQDKDVMPWDYPVLPITKCKICNGEMLKEDGNTCPKCFDIVLEIRKEGRASMLKDLELWLDDIDKEFDTTNSTVISAIRAYRSDIEKRMKAMLTNNPQDSLTVKAGSQPDRGATPLDVDAQSEQEISDTDMVTSKSGTLKSLPKDSPASVGRKRQDCFTINPAIRKGCGIKRGNKYCGERVLFGERWYCPSCRGEK